MLTIHFSHRYETLAELLADRLAAPGRSGFFAVDQVIVPSAALQRQLTLALARRHGICANVRFAYLARWLWQTIARVVPGVAAESPFDPALLVWRLYAALAASPCSEHPRLRAYLAEADATMRHQLAARLAALFDQYITYRPDWLESWSRGKLLELGAAGSPVQADQAWQAALWRGLAGDSGSTAPAQAFADTLQTRGAALVAAGTLPAEVHVFCLPTMAPLHLGLLQALGTCSEVHVYALNPCREYWFEVVDRRRLAYLAARGRDVHHEVGHRLLAGWGRQAQAHLAQLVAACGDAGVDDAHFETDDTRGPATMLARLQRAILDLEELAPGAITLADDDRSIEIHVCHSMARELEVLQDRLLGLFAGPRPPEPGDILVVVPDIDVAAPLIDAIFGTAPRDRRIPYQVTGRACTRINAPARVLVELLALVASRCPATAVFGLLQQPQVARRFGLDDDGLERIHGWLIAAGVHWALDDAHCAELDLPADGRHSFADGLERLFLGYALPGQAGEPFDGILARGAAEGSEALALGALWRFVEALSTLRRDIATAPLPARRWSARLARALDDFVAVDDGELEDLQDVRAALRQLDRHFEDSGFDGALPLEVIHSAVAGTLDDTARGGVPGGGVTFAALASLRNLPYRVICAIGLDDGVFPGSARPAEFDLIAAAGAARPGDRQRRFDDRNLFLDLLLAARETLHLSHVGRSVRDNTPLPPSVLVAELLETLLPAVAGATRARFVVEHPLQAFAAEAFRVTADPRLRSFQRDYALALQQPAPTASAQDLGATTVANEGDAIDDDDGRVAEPSQPFFTAALAPPGDEWLDVPLERLLRFFVHPCRFLLRQRLGVHLARDADELDDDESFVPDLPGRSALAQRLLPALLAGADLDTARRLARAGTELPAGALGAQAVEHELQALTGFAQTLRPLLAEPVLPPQALAVDIDAAGRRWRVHATLADLRASGLLRYRYDALRARDALGAWLPHLLRCAAGPEAPLRTRWQGRDEALVLHGCTDAPAVLARLIALYARGLGEPLYFFPKSAWKYLNSGDSVSAAASAWRATPRHPFGEEADPANRLALRGRPDPMGAGFDAFHACAHAVFDPLLASLEQAS
jgi:exodeoxyribonuclease V gamma subunit